MIPLRIVETERDDFEGPIAELWRDDEFVGQVFWDGETTIVQIYPTDDGDVHDLPVQDLQRVLDTAERMVDPFGFEQGDFVELRRDLSDRAAPDPGDASIEELMAEFDPQAVYRAEEGEGFFARDVGEQFIRRCEELALAVVEMEGFDLEGGQLKPRPGLELMIRSESTMSWPEFRTYANARAADTLAGWPRRASLVVAFVIQQPNGETIVA